VTPRGLADNHNHFMMEGSLARMLAAAEASPVVGEIAFTEHLFNFDEARRELPELQRYGPEGGRSIAYCDYVQTLDAIRDESGVPVRIGIELDALPGVDGYEERVAGFRGAREADWDVVLGSVHQLSDGSDVQGDPGLSADDAWDDYLEQLGRAVTSGRYDVVTHPVRLGVGVAGRPTRLDEGLRRLAGLATEAGVALEINGGDLRRRPDLVHELVDACGRERTTVSLGSDAHRPHWVGSVAGALPFLREAGITHAARFERRERTLVALP
jgi:histidinol phosphatase-like PHP family hydrolase